MNGMNSHGSIYTAPVFTNANVALDRYYATPPQPVAGSNPAANMQTTPDFAKDDQGRYLLKGQFDFMFVYGNFTAQQFKFVGNVTPKESVVNGEYTVVIEGQGFTTQMSAFGPGLAVSAYGRLTLTLKADGSLDMKPDVFTSKDEAQTHALVTFPLHLPKGTFSANIW